MFTTIFTIAVGWLATNITGKFTLDSDYAKRSAKYLFYFLSAITLLIVLFLSGLLIKNCYTNRQIDKTQDAVNELIKKEEKIESVADSSTVSANDLEKKAKLEEQKAEASEQAVKEIQMVEGVDKQTATNNLCEAYISTDPNRELPEICR